MPVYMRVTVQIPIELYSEISRVSTDAKVSLSQEIVERLAKSYGIEIKSAYKPRQRGARTKNSNIEERLLKVNELEERLSNLETSLKAKGIEP